MYFCDKGNPKTKKSRMFFNFFSMKKLLLMVAVALLGTATVNAQYKPEGLSLAVELNYAPVVYDFSANPITVDDGGFVLPEYGAKVRLFLNETFVVRLSLGLGVNSTNVITYYNDVNGKEQERDTKTSTPVFSLFPGIEYHFNKYERIFPYVGGELGILAGSTKVNQDNSENEDYTKTKNPRFGFGINVFTGVDVYLCKGLYLGAELGLGYAFVNVGRGTAETSVGGVITKADGNTSQKENNFGFHVNPALRVGWHF